MLKLLLPYMLTALVNFVRDPNKDNNVLVRAIWSSSFDLSLFLKILQTIAVHYGVPLNTEVILSERRNNPLSD